MANTKLAKIALGISPKRTLPPLAKQRFSVWFAEYQQPTGLTKSLILLNDTFTEFNHPEVGQAAVKLFNALGYAVLLPAWSCCGRPAFSKGHLQTARRQAEALIQELWKFAQKGLPIVGLEPSCLLMLRDDYRGLSLDQIPQGLTLDEFLAPLAETETFKKAFRNTPQKVKVHGHCHQKALVGMEKTLKVLKAVPGFSCEEIVSGCCGMAGSFGYEKEHTELSMKIGELHLFPAVRNAAPNEWIIASGMSCRHQIRDGTGRHSLHLAEALALHLR